MKDTKKILEKIEKEQAKLDALVIKRDEFTASYQTKLAEMNEGIKEQEKTISLLKKQEKAQKLDAVASDLKAKGISVDELLKAVTDGDFYSIQEKLENKGTVETTSESAPEREIF